MYCEHLTICYISIPHFGVGIATTKNLLQEISILPDLHTLGGPLGVMITLTYTIPNVLWTSYHMLYFCISFGGGVLINKKVIARNNHFCLFFILWGPPRGSCLPWDQEYPIYCKHITIYYICIPHLGVGISKIKKLLWKILVSTVILTKYFSI